VRLYLPRSEGHADVAPVSVDDAVPQGAERILVVEDDNLVREFVVGQLRALGYSVEAAPDASEALRLVDGGLSFDLLFTDVVMPGGMNGRQLAQEIRKRRPQVRVLFTSGYTESAVVHHGHLDPGIAILNKPYRRVHLAQKLREVLAAPPIPL
jgi:CheY-like chemotaxis protein